MHPLVLLLILHLLMQRARMNAGAQPQTPGAPQPKGTPQAQGPQGSGQGFQGEKGPMAASTSQTGRLTQSGVPQRTAQQLTQPQSSLPSLMALASLFGGHQA